MNNNASGDIKLNVEVKGLEKLKASLNGIKGSESAVQSLSEIISVLIAAQTEIGKLAKSNLNSDADRIVKTFQRTLSSLKKLNADGLSLPDFESIKNNIKNPTKGYGGNRAAIRKPLSDEAITRLATAQFTKDATIYIRNLEMLTKVYEKLNQEKTRFEGDPKIKKQKDTGRTSQYDSVRAKQLAEEEREILAKQIRDSKQRQKDNKETIAYLLKEKQLRESIKKSGNLSESIIGSGSKITGKELAFRIKEINAELKKMPENVRKTQSEKIAKDLETAGVKTRILNGALIVTSTYGKKIESHFAKTVKEMFSMDKLLSRISFVITAKLSYEWFDILMRSMKAAIWTNIEFRDEIAKTLALIAGESEQTKERLVKDVASIALKYRTDLKSTSEAMYEIISAQIAVRDSSRVLDASLRLSVGGFSNAKDAALALVQILNAYNLEASEANRIADITFETTRLGIITTQQYTDQISKIASTASMFGISIEEISAAISSMTRNGVKVEQAFTSLNQLLMTIANPTEQAKKTMDAYGVSIDMNTVRTNGLVNSLLGLGDILNSEEAMTDIVKSRTGAKAMFSLVQNAGDYTSDLISMYNSYGASEEAANVRLATTKSLWTQVKSEATDFLRIVGESLEPTVKTVFSTIGSLLSKTNGMLKAIIVSVRGIFFAFMTLVGIPKIISLINIGFVFLSKQLKAIKTDAGLGGLVGLVRALNLSLKATKVEAATAGVILKEAWASATLGLSILVGLLMQGVSWLIEMRKRAREARIDKALGAENVDSALSKVSKQIEKIDSQIGAIEGFNNLIRQSDSLYQSMQTNKKLTEQFNLVHGETVKALENVLGISINSAETQGRLSQYEGQLAEKWKKSQLERIDLLIKEQQLQQAKEISSSVKVMAGNKPGLFGLGKDNIDYQLLLAGFQHTSKEVLKINTSSNKQSMDNATKMLNNLSGVLDKFNGQSKESISMKGEISASIVGLQLYLNSVATGQMNKALTGAEIPFPKITKPNIAGDGGGGKPSEQSFLSDATTMFDSLFGDKIYESYEELQLAMKNKVAEIRSKIEKAQGDKTIINDLAETEKILTSATDVITNGSFIQIIEEGTKAVNNILENAKSLRQSGDTVGSESELKRAMMSYDNYSKFIGMLSNLSFDDIYAINPNISTKDAHTLIENAKNAGAEFMFNMLSQIKSAMSDEDFLKEAIKRFGLSEEILVDYDALIKALDEAEKSGQTNKAEILKTISGKLMEALKKQINEIIGFTELNDFDKEVERAVNQAISEGKSKDEVKTLLSQIIAAGVDSGVSMTSGGAKAVGKTIDDKFTGFDWKGLLGIKDYKDKNAAIMDVAGQTIGTLKSAWSFYMDWESAKYKEQIDALQEASDKKLEILDREKDLMLSNSNMSEQQRTAITERFNEKQAALQKQINEEKTKMETEQAEKMAKLKRKQAIFDATVNLAQGLIGIWTKELGTKTLLGIPIATALAGMLTGIYAAQLAMIMNTKYAEGGYTGSGSGSPDSTGYKPAGIVHEGELVIDKKTLDNNFDPMMSLYQHLHSGKGFDSFMANYMMGNISKTKVAARVGSFASGGYAGHLSQTSNAPTVIDINLTGARVIDDVELHKRVQIGGEKRRVLNG